MQPTFRLFYSWQSDRPSELGRHFIAKALELAAEAVSSEIGVTIEIDSDTKGEPGTPPITDTILRKIRESDAFAGDMSFVARTDNDKLIPNPNVMGEYGYALSQKGSRRILLMMNKAYGPPHDLPFDLSNLRHPLLYEAAPGISDGQRRAERTRFAKSLEEPLKLLVNAAREEKAQEEGTSPIAAERAREMIATLMMTSGNGSQPAVVSNPKVFLYFAPFAAFAGHPLDIRAARRALATVVPTHLGAAGDGVDENEWWIHGSKFRIPDLPNPETIWYARLIRPGIFEIALNLARKIGNDPRALLKGYQAEAAIVDMLDKCAAASGELGMRGRGIVSSVLMVGDEIEVTMGRSNGRLSKPFVKLGETEVPDVDKPVGDHLRSIFDNLWLAAGIASGSLSYDEGQWAGYRGELPYRL